MTETNRVAVCGLGNMGSQIARRLALAFTVHGFDLEKDKVLAAVEFGMEPWWDLETGEPPTVVVLSLPSPRASVSVVRSLAPRMVPGSVIVETSTVNPSDIAELAAIAAESGIGVVDAAVAAGVGQMSAGTAALLVGGADRDVDRVYPVLEAMSAKVVRLGDSGRGAALKVINNAIAHAVMVVIVEATALAKAAGIPQEHLIELMTGNDAGLTRPLEHRLMERVAQADYEGGMPTDAARKDSTLALELAQSLRVPLFAIQGSHVVYELAVAEGKGRLDYASIATLWEEWLGSALSWDPAESAK